MLRLLGNHLIRSSIGSRIWPNRLFLIMTRATHYETLGLPEGCSHKEIKRAFLDLSKKYHPDKNSTDPGLHSKFVSINEAYSVLSKAPQRSSYDATLRNSRLAQQERMNGNAFGNSVRYESDNFVFRDESLWSMRDRSKDRPIDKDRYYGIKGIRRKPNSWIAAGVFVLMGIGALIHYVHYKHSSAFALSRLDSRDQRLSKILESAKPKPSRMEMTFS